jgi:hypothetical protein
MMTNNDLQNITQKTNMWNPLYVNRRRENSIAYRKECRKQKQCPQRINQQIKH